MSDKRYRHLGLAKDTHSEPPVPAGRHKDRPLSWCAIRTMGEVELSSALAPLSRCRIASPLAGVPSPPRKRILQTLSAIAIAQDMSPAPLSASLSKAALHTVMSMWSMSMTCMGAWLGGRRLTYSGRHTHPKRKERQRAPVLGLALARVAPTFRHQPLPAEGLHCTRTGDPMDFGP